MRYRYYTGVAVALCACALCACKKELPPVYGDNHGVYVDGGLMNETMVYDNGSEVPTLQDSISLSLLTTTGSSSTVYVKVITKGRLDYERDRYFDAVVVDSLPTDSEYVLATGDEYELGDMVIKAGMEYGLWPITLKKSDRILNDNACVQIMIRLVSSADFPYVGTYTQLNGKSFTHDMFKVKWSNLIQMPSTWNTQMWDRIFGDWNRVKFQFMLNTLGETAPDWETQAPGIGMPLNMTNYNMSLMYKTVIKNAFAIYKDNSAKDPVAYPPLYYPADSETWITFPN